MFPFLKKSHQKTGLPPGTLVYTGESKSFPVEMEVILYDEETYQKERIQEPEDVIPVQKSEKNLWLNINGIHESEIISETGRLFSIHPIILEDIMHTDQRPKMEEFDEYSFLVFNMLYFDGGNNQITSEQVSLIWGEGWLITFQEKPGDVFDSIRQRLEKGLGRVRKMNTDYLSYILLDAVVDQYFIMLDKIAERIEELDEELKDYPETDTLQNIYDLKKEILFLRKSIWPLRELILQFQKSASTRVSKSTQVFVRDLYDHVLQVMETIQMMQDMIAEMLNLYMSVTSNRMNEIMKVLTLIATIFIPLTFIAGVYGMNFKWMPELEWKWGYPLAMLGMLTLGVGMFWHFKRKKWF
jgi:magnesium transporter